MNYFEQQQLAKIRMREARHAGEWARLAKLVPSRFRVWRWRAFGEWMLGELVLFALCVWIGLSATAQGVTRPIRAKRAEGQLLALAENFRQCQLVNDVETIKF